MKMFDSEFITQVEAVADSFDADTMEPQHAIDGIRLLKQIVEKRRDYVNSGVVRRLLSAEMFEARKAWEKEARKAWVASLPSPVEVGLSPLARCGDYVDPSERPERGYRLSVSGCSHKAKYATTAKRWIASDPGPMRVYCGVHANEIANGNVQFPRGEIGEAIYREAIEDFDERRRIANR